MEALKDVWRKLLTFPHVFEVAAARGDLDNYDLNGQRHEVTTPSIQHVSLGPSQGQWKVPLMQYNTLLEKGSLEPSVMELYLSFLKPHLPEDVLVKNVFALRSRKTSLDHLPKYKNPRVQVFPYRSNSNIWAFFLITTTESGHTLHIVTPHTYTSEALDWATKHLQCQYGITESPTYSTWSSERGSELLSVLGLLRVLFPDTNWDRLQEDSYVNQALSVMRELRETAVNTNEARLDVLLGEREELRRETFNIFRTLLPTSKTSADAFLLGKDTAGQRIPLPKKRNSESSTAKSGQENPDEQRAGVIPKPKRLSLIHI